MNQEKIGAFIKKLRVDNNLTQNEFAKKLSVTYQAVSKWENGKSIPDMATLKMISDMFDLNIDDIINGDNIKNKSKNRLFGNKKIIIIIFILLVVLVILLGINLFFYKDSKNNDIKINDITTKCKDFNVTGTLIYDNNYTYIRISNVEHCGDEDEVYAKIECVLYEQYGNLLNKISECDTSYNETLKDHLKNVKLNANKYSMICHKVEDSSFYLEINATKKDGKVTTFKIPLEVKDNCIK